MKIRRRFTGVLRSFLDGYTSRYSDYDGYWIFGLLAREDEHFSFSLLHGESGSRLPILEAASEIARERFASMLGKSGIPRGIVASARLDFRKLEPLHAETVNGQARLGNRMAFIAEAKSDLGKLYRAEKIIFVAPHDPAMERRSARRRV